MAHTGMFNIVLRSEDGTYCMFNIVLRSEDGTYRYVQYSAQE